MQNQFLKKAQNVFGYSIMELEPASEALTEAPALSKTALKRKLKREFRYAARIEKRKAKKEEKRAAKAAARTARADVPREPRETTGVCYMFILHGNLLYVQVYESRNGSWVRRCARMLPNRWRRDT